MWTDPIIEELDKYREKVAEKFGYNLGEIIHYYQSQQQQAGQEIVSFRSVKTRRLQESAELYAELYDEDPELRTLTESASRN